MIVALTITDQDSVIRTGAVKSEFEGLPPPRMDRVASITIETAWSHRGAEKDCSRNQYST